MAATTASQTFAGKVALITGASQGIGAEIARRFARAGAAVLLSGRRAEALDGVAGEIRAHGGQARVLLADLADPAQTLTLARGAEPVDILVNNAAVHGHDIAVVPLIESRDQDLDAAFAVNVKSPYILMRELGRGMAGRGSGAIINISSVAAHWAVARRGLYSASKAALNALTRALAVELGAAGVRCNAIAPGLVITPPWEGTDIAERLRPAIPLARPGLTSEVAATALWLASPEAAFITGQVIVVDGGMTLGFARGPDA